jgi:serine/threonine-protein kinase
MLAAYGRLHGAGVIHGDVHPGNCIVLDRGDVVLLDFGNGRALDGPRTTVDPARAGIPHFHDPLMAAELVAGRLPPAATPASEQFSIAVLAYLLLTGLHPIEAPAVQDELLRHIATRRPLPFASRGVAAWPSVEAVLGRAMAPDARDRFADVDAFSRALASATVPTHGRPRWPASATRALDSALDEVRNVAPTTGSARDVAWFGLRSALAFGDAELLAAADILSRRAGRDWPGQAVAAHVAQARSDQRTASRSVAGFIAAVARLRSEAGTAAAILVAATLLEDARSRSQDQAALADWARRSLDGLARATRTQGPDAHRPDLLVVHASLALVKAGAVPIPAGLPADLEALREQDAGGVWLWALAHDVFADDRFMAQALGAPLPKHPLGRSFALLRLHQLTGERTWATRARQAVQSAPSGDLPDADLALLMVELRTPERATLPPYLVPRLGAGRRPGGLRRVS